MNWTNRTQKKIIGYSTLFKKMGIINEEEYKQIMNTVQSKDQLWILIIAVLTKKEDPIFITKKGGAAAVTKEMGNGKM